MRTQFNELKFKALVYDSKQVLDVTHINLQHSIVTLNVNLKHTDFPISSVYLMQYFGLNFKQQEIYEYFIFSEKSTITDTANLWMLINWNNEPYLYNVGSNYLYRQMDINVLRLWHCHGFIEEYFLKVVDKIRSQKN